jgi:polyisoprenoid-binding protein YceI
MSILGARQGNSPPPLRQHGVQWRVVRYLWKEATVIRLLLLVALATWGSVCSSARADNDQLVPFHLIPAASRVWFDADAPLHSFRGETQQLTGHFTLRRRSPPQLADAVVTIGAASLATGHPERDADMRRDFLEVERFPTIEFRVDTLLTPSAAAADGTWDVVLQGKLTVHGVTRDVKVPTTISLDDERVTGRGRIHLDMQDYNIRVPRLWFLPMTSEVLVGFEVVARSVR